MLFTLNQGFTELRPLPFEDFAGNDKVEKELENLIAKHLFGVLFDRGPLLPIHQERRQQPEADIYAVNKDGDIVVLELKRSSVSRGALHQLLRYTEVAGKWSYSKLNAKFQQYPDNDYPATDLAEAQKEAFGLDNPLGEEAFNQRQHMMAIGSAADEELMEGVEFWKKKGLSIDFLPYRIYKLSDAFYFEFFAKPYDSHVNPGTRKGILFDTCRSYYPDGLQWMIEKRRISAFGSRKDAVHSLSKGDLVFYSHRWVGLVAAAKVVSTKVKSDTHPGGEGELHWDVEFLTNPPGDFEKPRGMPFRRVVEVTGHNFFWARTQKTPYLKYDEAETLLAELKKVLEAAL